MADLEEEQPFTLRSYIQTLTRISKPQFEEKGSTIEDWIRAVCSNEESLAVGEEIRSDTTWPRKNEELSRRNREDGNQAYQEEQFELAITLYTEAMRFAPCNPVLLEGEALAWAAANRSAAFYQQQQYRQALEDIEIAIAAGYPSNSIYKLYIRRCKCELEMGRISKAQEVAICFSSVLIPLFVNSSPPLIRLQFSSVYVFRLLTRPLRLLSGVGSKKTFGAI